MDDYSIANITAAYWNILADNYEDYELEEIQSDTLSLFMDHGIDVAAPFEIHEP